MLSRAGILNQQEHVIEIKPTKRRDKLKGEIVKACSLSLNYYFVVKIRKINFKPVVFSHKIIFRHKI